MRAEVSLSRIEARRDFVERFVPCDARELTGALWSGAAHRKHQSVGMMDTLGIARDLRADHARRVGLMLGAANPADRRAVDHLDVERASRRAIMRTGRMFDINLGACVHGENDNNINRRCKSRLCINAGAICCFSRLSRKA